MTSEEIEILTPACENCILPAVVVERQLPFESLTAPERNQPLITVPNGYLKFYCAIHTALTVPADVTARNEDDLLRRLSTSVACEKRGDHRYASVCVRYQDQRRCVRRCEPIKRLTKGLTLSTAQQAVINAWERHEARKKKLKEP